MERFGMRLPIDREAQGVWDKASGIRRLARGYILIRRLRFEFEYLNTHSSEPSHALHQMNGWNDSQPRVKQTFCSANGGSYGLGIKIFGLRNNVAVSHMCPCFPLSKNNKYTMIYSFISTSNGRKYSGRIGNFVIIWLLGALINSMSRG